MKRRFANLVNNGNIDYEQKKIDEAFFSGYISKLRMKQVEKPCFVENAYGKYCTLNTNFVWFRAYPNDENYALTIMFDEKNNLIQWYFDVALKIGILDDIPFEDDLFLDLVVFPDGKSLVLDEDELVEAQKDGLVSNENVKLAYATIQKLKKQYVEDFENLKTFTDFIIKKFTK